MAFGFGFNKQKVLSAAEKFVQQGKLQNAISEYEKVLKADAKDLTVMNTVGDLYARLGENEKAADCFKSVGDAYAGQGFTVKAIAMYKKLGKLKSSTESVLRLAELYTQQGLFNDARAQYLQVAEDFLKSGKADQAIRIFQKTLEMDPDNVPMRMRLAEAYVRMGKKDDAWQLLSTAAETLRSKGQLAAANEILQKMLKLDPGDSYALVLRGRACVEAGDYPAAIECLSKVADLDNNADGLRALLQAYIHSKRFTDASALVTKLANVHGDVTPVFEFGSALLEAQQYRPAIQVYTDLCDQLLRADSAKLFESLRALLGYIKDDPQLLEMVLAIFQRGGETTQLTDIYELLAHAHVQSGEPEKAREYYKKLMQLEPANQMHVSNYQQVSEKLGSTSASHLITAEEGAALVDELEASAPFIEQLYDDEIALAVKAALTDADLFISYKMPAKALDPLISVLPKAPRDLRVNQKLAALHTRAGRFAEAAVCCRTLESIYHDAGHAAEASRYSDVAVKYEQRDGSASQSTAASPSSDHAGKAAVQEFQIPAPASNDSAHPQASEPDHGTQPATAAPASGIFFDAPAPAAQSQPAQEFSVSQPSAAEEFSVTATSAHQESESADDWEQGFSVEAPQEIQPAPEVASQQPSAPAAEEPLVRVHEVVQPAKAAAPVDAPEPNLEESIQEVRFYLTQGMVSQAEELLKKLEAVAPESPELAVLRLGIDSAKQIPTSDSVEPEISIDETPELEAGEPAPESIQAEPKPSHVQAPQIPVAEHATITPQPWPAQREIHVAPAAEPVAPAAKAEPAAEHEQAPAEASPPGAFGLGTLDAFVADLEASLGSDFIPEEPAAPPPAAAPVASVPPPPPVPSPAIPRPAAAPVAAQREVPVARAAAASASAVGAPPVPATAPILSPPASSDLNVSVDLSSMFGELKQELEHDVATAEEDPETHYNLGVAFREMGLLDEAIGELQKVCQYIDRGRPFPHVIQTYTWLAQCFLDKGVPEVAARWYEKALKLPSLDQETRTALHYELASALETAGRKPEALNNFLEVYSANIDYRDVAERIKALRA